MGVVWKATDTSLDRPVALKALPPAFAADAERLARFEREARLLASLNHPNIATVYSVHVVEGVRYLSMEFVPGEDLAQRLARGPVPVSEALEIARQIALALEAAHENGVVHRDLKPANVRLIPDGRVKVLDFGLAKALEAGAASAPLSQSPTFAVSAMTAGMIIGTAAYMSPEQARGQSVDRRADIWAFGVVLYEMLAGRRAFEGETVSDTLAAVLRAEPDRAALPADLPPAVRALLDRCLEKNARRRLRDIGEAVVALEDVQAGRTAAAPAPQAPGVGATGRSWWPWLASVVLLIALAVALAGRGPRPAPLRKFTLTLDDGGAVVTDVAISPNGRTIAYVRQGRLMLRDLGQTTSRVVAEGLSENFRPAWSPNSESLVLGTSGQLERVEASSGAITELCPVSDFSGGSGATWLGDGTVVFARGQDHLYRIPEGGGTPEVYLQRQGNDIDLHHPFALPGGRGVLYVRHLQLGGPIVLAVASGGKRHDLLRLSNGYFWQPVYDPRGYIVFTRGGDVSGLWAAPFSLGRLAITGEPRMIAPGASSASISSDGMLVYRIGEATFTSADLVLLHRSGTFGDTLFRDLKYLWSMALSPDGHSVAMDIRPYGDPDIWVADLERRSMARFAFGPGAQMDPEWSADGSTVYYCDEALGLICARPADGAVAARPVARGIWPRLTPDGSHFLCTRDGGPARGSEIWYVSSDGRDSLRLAHGPGNEQCGTPGPRGGYYVYQSDEGGSSEIYLRPYPNGDARWQVSVGGGAWPVWSPRGDHIYYRNNLKFYEVDVTLEPSVRLGNPRVLFDATALSLQMWGRFTLLPTRDPDLFLAERRVQHNLAGRVDAVVVENWPAEFAKQ